MHVGMYDCMGSEKSELYEERENTLTEAMKARQKCPLAGPTTGCSANKDTCIKEKQRVG
jgi:hypothetical protein